MITKVLGGLRRRLVERFWSRRFAGDTLRTWMHEPLVRRAINRRITGDEHCWPLDHFATAWGDRSFDRGLSLGCGDGRLERDVLGKRICRTMEALDLSPTAVELARQQAAVEGFGEAVTYRVADLDALELPESVFDIAFFHQSLHHVADLEGCLDQVRGALAPGGILYLDELVGPSRTAWAPELLVDAQAAFDRLPSALKRRRKLGYPVDWRDPSEAVRSGEILEQVEQRFEIVERRDYGGHLLAMIHPMLRPEALASEAGQTALAELLATEDELLARGAATFYTVITART